MIFMKNWKELWEGKTEPLFLDTEESRNALASELKLLIGPEPPLRILEIGCGNGALFQALGFDKSRMYTGNDLSSTMALEFQRRYPQLKLIVGPGEKYVDSEKYDLIFSNGVIQYFSPSMLMEHIGHTEHMLAPGGKLLLASLPWRQARGAYYHGALMGFAGAGGRRMMKAWMRSLFGSYMGRWWDHKEIARMAAQYSMSARFHGSLYFPYRFHVVLRRA